MAMVIMPMVFTLDRVEGLASSQVGGVNFSLIPASANVASGGFVVVSIQFDATGDPVGAVQAYLQFDPMFLEVVDLSSNPVSSIEAGSVFTGATWPVAEVLENFVDNTAGEINFAGGKGLSTGVDAFGRVFELAIVRFRVSSSVTGVTNVTFSSARPRQSKAVSGFSDVTGSMNGSALTVGLVSNSPPMDIVLSANSVKENQLVGTLVAILTAVDVDAADSHVYKLVEGAGDADNLSFQIVDDQLQTKAVFDFEVKASLKVRIQADDLRGGLFQKAYVIDVANLIDRAIFRLDLQGQPTAPSTNWTMPFTVEFYSPGTSNLLASFTPVTAPSSVGSSSFSLTDLPPDIYDVWAKGAGTLAIFLPSVDLTIEPVIDVDLGQQKGGDFNGDNVADGLDFSALLEISAGSPISTLPVASQLHDYNRDGFVGDGDYSILVTNFGESGSKSPGS